MGGVSLREGRVEICVDRVWGTVCDSAWDSRDAQVVCRQLGYTSFGKNYTGCTNAYMGRSEGYYSWLNDELHSVGAESFSNAYFGRGTGLLLLDRLGCSGREQTLLSCYHSGVGVTSSYCGHDDDAGVRCQGNFSIASHLV